ncbi:MAG: M6 family metalloprotease domain-containing protein [Paludibacteraceae bacterium]
MQTLNKKTTILLFILLLAEYISAVPAYQMPVIMKQPDGREITFRLYGDEHFSYKTTTDDYLITEDNDGYLTYAEIDKKGIIHSLGVKVNELSKRSINEIRFVNKLKTTTNDEFNNQIKNITNARKINIQKNIFSEPRKFPIKGSPRSLVILVNFSDKNFVTSNPQQAFTDLLNQEGYSTNSGTGSAKDYFRDNSNSAFDPIFDVVGPYTLPNNMSYYGESSSSSNDSNPRQMVIDACTLADADGIDFSIYDTDNDGYIDNVFIYYAGYNEAEGGASSTVWPHRWVVSSNLKLDGKYLYDYACTSELRGYSGSKMCGIGTFVHEFGHVLGLPDLYATNYASHHTLSSWDVMDAGPYNNSGRTPPAYSSYERFYLGWLTPTELKNPQNVTLDTLTTSNQAYLISQTGNNNLNGENPNPVEFFMLENRQKKGWDTYLPGHGLLITRIYYSSSGWHNNTVNNTASSMGVDIIEADGLATDATNAGDTYPGTSNNSGYSPTLRNGTDIGKPLTYITESNGIITFKIMNGVFLETNAPIATAATDITQTSFTANWNAIPYAEKYLLDIFEVIGNDTIYVSDYKRKDIGTIININIDGLNEKSTYYYRLKAVNGTVTTIYSNIIEVKTTAYTFNSFKPTALEASDITNNSFNTNWSWSSKLFVPESYYLTVYTKESGTGIEYITTGFDNNSLPEDWTADVNFFTTSGYYASASPSAYFTTENEYIQTPIFEKQISSLSFWYRGRSTSSSNALLIYASKDGKQWELFKTIQPISTNSTNFTISDIELPECFALKLVYSKPAIGNIAIDDIKIGLRSISNIPLTNYDNINVGSVTQYSVEGLNGNEEILL